MKKTALVLTFVFALLVSSVFGVQIVDVVEANPFWGRPQYPAKPCQDFPTIKIEAPRNGEVLETTAAEVIFTVTKPYSWNAYYGFPKMDEPAIGSYIVYIYLDGKLRGTKPDPGPTGFPYADYSLVLDKLERGSHNVSVIVVATTFYDDPETDSFNVTTGVTSPPLTYPRNITETRQFTTNVDLPTPTPSPSPQPTPTAEPFPTTLVIAFVITVAAVGIGLLVYFKKRHNAKTNKHREVEQSSTLCSKRALVFNWILHPLEKGIWIFL
jgi:hypothetical protein